MQSTTLFNEYRLIERSESEVNGSWKGAHLLLFFLAFVFGSFCTFCFHMLMYLFDEKCVLFPKLISINSVRQKTVNDFLPIDKDTSEMLPVDFLSTQWVDKAVCYLPTYVPLVSGIFGLVWTTMFLMCSTGSRTLTGLQRPWRVLPPVFVFSLAMGGLCVYASAVTHYGLQELCIKLGEFTGDTTCSYTINIATLAYERRIRGVYQVTRLTILSAWLHTSCWLLSALLTLVRVLMAVDFQLVKINVELTGDMDKILERHEKLVRCTSSVVWINKMEDSSSSLQINLRHSSSDITRRDSRQESEEQIFPSTMIYLSVPKNRRFIVKMLYDLLEVMDLPKDKKTPRKYEEEWEELDALKAKEVSIDKLAKQLLELRTRRSPTSTRSVSPPINVLTSPQFKQVTGLKTTDDIKSPISHKQSGTATKKSNLIHKGVQTDKKAKKSKKGKPKVQIQLSDFKSDDSTSGSGTLTDEVDNETQTKGKEKQD